MRVFFEHARNGDFNAMLKVESMKYVWERARRIGYSEKNQRVIIILFVGTL